MPMAPMGSSAPRPQATVIAKGVKVEGDFASDGDVTIEGEVGGKVSANGVLTVGPEAKIKADVKATEAVIAGEIDGTLTVAKRLELRATALIKGNVTCDTLAVDAGATLNGQVTTTRGKSAANPSA